MDHRELTQEFIDAFQAGNFKKAESLCADDFKFSGATPEPLSVKEWMGLSKGMKAAFPDLNYNMKILSVDGNKVVTTSQLTGTHTGKWDLSGMGLGVIEPTGIAFSNPEQKSTSTIENGKLTNLHIEGVEGGGLPGILAKLGISIPVK